MLFNVTNWPGGNIFHKLVSRFVIKYYNRNIIKQLRQHILFNYRWSAESVFAKNLLSIVHLLLAIVTFYQTRKNIYLDLPKSLNIDVLIIRSLNGSTTYKKETETLFRYGMISMIFIFLVVCRNIYVINIMMHYLHLPILTFSKFRISTRRLGPTTRSGQRRKT